MAERTTTGFGNLVTYEGKDTLDRKARKAVESAQGGRVDWSQVYSNYTEAAQHTLMRPPIECLCFERRARYLWIAG
jgi:hypothetical protein